MLILSLLFSSVLSFGATIAPVSNSEIIVLGNLTETSADNFTVQFNKVLLIAPDNTPITIYLNSEGGSLDTAESIFKTIRVAQKYGVEVNTQVVAANEIASLLKKATDYGNTDEMESIVIAPAQLPEKSICLSACTIIFSAGTKRIATKDSIFLLHAPITPESLKGVLSEQKLAADAAEYKSMWREALNQASPKLAKHLVDDLKVLDEGKDDFAATADELQKAFPDFIHELTPYAAM